MQVGAMKIRPMMAECSLSYAKIVQARAMRTCSRMAECSLSYAKIVQTRAMRTCSRMAECSLSYAKIVKNQRMAWKFRLFVTNCNKKRTPDMRYAHRASIIIT